MLKRMFVLGALLGGAPLFSQNRTAAEPEVVKGEFVWFRLAESKQEVGRVMGLPHLSADFGADYHSWRYRVGDIDHDEFSYAFIFRRSTGRLVAVTRTFEEERKVDAFFPAAQTRAYCRGVVDGVDYCVRLRRLDGGRLLIAGGASKPGDPVSQLVLIQESELPAFFSWLPARMDSERAAHSGVR